MGKCVEEHKVSRSKKQSANRAGLLVNVLSQRGIVCLPKHLCCLIDVRLRKALQLKCQLWEWGSNLNPKCLRHSWTYFIFLRLETLLLSTNVWTLILPFLRSLLGSLLCLVEKICRVLNCRGRRDNEGFSGQMCLYWSWKFKL